MKKSIFIEGDNFLTLRKETPYQGYEESKNNVLWELTTLENSKFVILADENNISPLNVYSERDMGGHPAGVASIYESTNGTHANHHVLIHQNFFKLSGDGDLRRLGFQAWQMEEIIIHNDDIFPKGKDWVAFFLIESGNAVYPISVRPFRHTPNLYGIGLESLSDLSFYACIRPTFFIAR